MTLRNKINDYTSIEIGYIVGKDDGKTYFIKGQKKLSFGYIIVSIPCESSDKILEKIMELKNEIAKYRRDYIGRRNW